MGTSKHLLTNHILTTLPNTPTAHAKTPTAHAKTPGVYQCADCGMVVSYAETIHHIEMHKAGTLHHKTPTVQAKTPTVHPKTPTVADKTAEHKCGHCGLVFLCVDSLVNHMSSHIQ